MASDISRSSLPIPTRKHVGLTTYDAKDPDTSFPPIEPLHPPKGAPNVLIVLLDDVGFGAAATFGGLIDTPTADRLAAGGLRYTRFHTTALCAPTRQALLTGRNHHSVGMGTVTELATAAPGYSSVRPDTAAPLADTLRMNGYSTAQFGKCHEVPVWQSSPMGPFTQWPTGSGFQYFYGFIGGETNQYYPAIYEGTTPLEPATTPEEGYHFTEDMTDKAIAWVRQQRSLMTDRPFFMYYAPGATHAPHQVPPEWADKYKGRFDDGWDATARGHLRPAEGPGGHPRRRRAHRPAGRDPRLRRHARRAQAGPGPADGDLRRLPRAHRPPRRSAHRRPRGHGRPRRDARLLHHRRQRCVRRGPDQRHVQRDAEPQRCRGSGDPRVHGLPHRRLRRAGGLQPLRGGLVPRHVHALPVDQAGRLALGRDPQRHHRALAQRLHGQGRGPRPVPPRHRPRPHGARGRRHRRAHLRQRHPAAAHRGREHALHVRRPRRRPSGGRPSTSRCSATGGSTTEGWTAVTRHSHRGT